MTDPARTTKEELLPCPFCGAAALLEDDDAGCMNDQCILTCFAYPLERWNTRADAADALRAQVAALQAERDEVCEILQHDEDEYHEPQRLAETAEGWVRGKMKVVRQFAAAVRELAALQAENERLQKAYEDVVDGQEALIQLQRREWPLMQAELAAAQAKLAVPVPKDVEDLIAWLDTKWRRHGEIEDRNARDAAESLARDNAALRTQAEALERERDGLKADAKSWREYRQRMQDTLRIEHGSISVDSSWITRNGIAEKP